MNELDSAAKKAFSRERNLEPRPDAISDLMRSFDRESRRRDGRRRLTTLGSALAACAVVLTMAIPQSRAAIVDGLASFLGGGSPPPGQAINPTALPGYAELTHALNGSQPEASTVVGSGNGLRLFAWTNPTDRRPCFSLDQGDTMCLDGGQLVDTLTRQHVAILAATGGPGTSGVLWGLATDGAVKVELRYETGPPSTAESETNGFILPVDSQRAPVALVAYSPTGDALFQVAPAALRPLGLASMTAGNAGWKSILGG